MAEFKINNNSDLTPKGIGSTPDYTQNVRNRINKKIGGVYTIGTEFRNANLMNNPFTLRYKNHENAQASVEGTDIGEIYRIEDRKGLTNFLDENRGLIGFTFGDAFETSMLNMGNGLINFTFGTDTNERGKGDMTILPRLDKALFMARQTSFERNGTKVVERYMTNGGGFKFDASYSTTPGTNYSFGDRDVRGLQNRILQLYADVFGLEDYSRVNIHNRHINKTIYNPSLPLNPMNGKGVDFKRYNPLRLLQNAGILDVFSVDDKQIYKQNQIFYGGEIGEGISSKVGSGEYDKLDRLNALYNNENNLFSEIPDNLSEPAKEAIRDAKNVAALPFQQYIEKEKKFDDVYSVGNRNWNNTLPSIEKLDYKEDIEGKLSTYESYNDDGVKEVGTINVYNEENKYRRDSLAGDFDEKHVVVLPIDENTSISDNKKSLLYKTNQLFKNGKINSMISRFHNSLDNEQSVSQTAVNEKYGVSRGRNLTKSTSETHNGYDNPYCRVWTAHYQYSKYGDLIRHKGYGSTDSVFLPSNTTKLRPHDAEKRLSDMSVLMDNGLPSITPYKQGKDIIKKYMFSIENLAWKDVLINKSDILSEEQKGPNGGRIMWFPPYNLKFNENVSSTWNGNSFIGRGEQIYTYVNTDRGGTLNFTLLIDHPSVIDSWAYNRSTDNINAEDELAILRFFAGCDDGNGGNGDDGRVSEQIITESEGNTVVNHQPEIENPGLTNTPKPQDEDDATLHYFVFFPNDFSGYDYLGSDVYTAIKYLQDGSKYGVNGYEMGGDGLKGCINSPTIVVKRSGTTVTWHYEVDKAFSTEVLLDGNYEDRASFGLNSDFRSLLEGDKGETIMKILQISKDNVKDIFSFNEMLSADFSMIRTFFRGTDTFANVQDDEIEITVDVKGYASSHGYAKNNEGTGGLAGRRARVIKKYLETLNFTDKDNIKIVNNKVITLDEKNKDVSSLEAKLGRCAEVIIKANRKDKTPVVDNTKNAASVKSENNNQNKVKTVTTQVAPNSNVKTNTVVEVINNGSYDNEYLYFKKINGETDSFIRKNIVDKVHYFDPAFHSITPEGFNGRLTFLHQCTRQGPTSSMSDVGSNQPRFAGNLAFGRPPVCVLRIGDFYNTKIIIDSLSIDYDNSGIQWDLNPEGAGVQPMLANISITFKFLGGSDLSGPIARLQNAVSYNYYANASVYDNRADYRKGVIMANDDSSHAWNASTGEFDDFATTNTTNNGVVKKRDTESTSQNVDEYNRSNTV